MDKPEQILTISAVLDGALSSSDYSGAEAQVKEAILDAQGLIENHLHQKVMVHRTTQLVEPRDWLVDERTDTTKVRAWAETQPVVQVVSPPELSVRIGGSRQFVRNEAQVTEAEYFAGWRRRDQALSDLPTGTDERLDGLTTEPPPLPGEIRRVALNLTLYALNEAEHAPGITDRQQATGAGTVTISGPDPGFEQRQLRKLDRYRRAQP